MWVLGLDLGQAADATALAVVEVSAPPDPEALPTYDVRHLERWVGLAYPEQVRRVGVLLADPALEGAMLAIDRTGVGRAPYDMFVAAGIQPLGVTVHGGDQVAHDGDEWRVPKRDLIFAAVALLQQRRLRIAQGLLEAGTLVQELQNYRV